ncbi:hypothetical protein COX84_07120 [Candidatus Micrarchaeota archaeon CG_4_10_14_0_2_um_filter_49_7]|nr:MAG: hypothetical protein COX84_07120 [Candidatus Micrarchaeota archaeon CG_4_10_14_0_2_um_filter_49_7]
MHSSERTATYNPLKGSTACLRASSSLLVNSVAAIACFAPASSFLSGHAHLIKSSKAPGVIALNGRVRNDVFSRRGSNRNKALLFAPGLLGPIILFEVAKSSTPIIILQYTNS